MTNFTLTILFFLSFFGTPSSEIEVNLKILEPVTIMESDLVITEIMYHPNSADNSWEWIEIYNKGMLPIDLTGYVLDDNNNTKQGSANISEGTIEPGGIAILFDADVTIEEFTAVWGELNAIPVNGWPGLNNSGDSIGIWDSFEDYDGDNVSQLNVIEQVIYDDANSWVDSNAASSIYLTGLDKDNTLGDSWALSEIGTADAYQSNELHGNTGGDVGSPGIVPIMEDTTPPAIACPEMVETNTDEGLCSAAIPLLAPSASDNVSTVFTFSAVRSDGLELDDPFPVGDTVITWTATDEADNTSEPCDQLVRIMDVELPTAVAQNITVELNDNGLAVISPEDLDNPQTPSFDNCGIAEYMANKIEFSCADLGTPVLVEFSVLDANGNTSVVTNAVVTVVDKLKPIMTCDADIVTISSNGNAVTLEDVSEPVVTDNCGGSPVLSFSRSDEEELNAPFGVGTTTITWQAVDASNNIATCTQTIVVDFIASTDNDIISFSIPGQVGETVIDASAKTIALSMPIGTDVTALIPSFDISDNATSIPELGDAVNFTQPRSYVIKAQDGTEQEWIVTVNVEEDTTPPTFVVKGNTEDFVTELEVGDTYVVGEILNIVDESITVSEILGVESVDTTKAGGPFLVTYGVSDGTNSTAITETVIVNDSGQEVLSITSFTLVNADTNEDLFVLEKGMQIDFRSLPTLHLDIRADATDDTKSVHLSLNGALIESRTENVSPYALYGDFPERNYFGEDFVLGAYSITAIPYSEKADSGEMGQSLSLDFAIIDVCENFEISLLDVFDNSTCLGADGFALIAQSGGAVPIVYSWSHDTELFENSVTELTSGTYTVMAKDANNCTAELTFELKGPILPEVTLSPFDSVDEDEEPFILSGGSPVGGSYSGEGIVDGIFDPSIGQGTYEITYTFTDGRTSCTNSHVQSIEVLQPVLKVQGFTLVNADNNQDIMHLTEGMQINLGELPTMNLNIRANTTDDVNSVQLTLNGDSTTMRTENVSPYALYGDFPAKNYFGNEFTVGSYTITADPYSEEQLDGEKGASLTVNFDLLDTELSGKSLNSMSVSPNPATIKTTLNFQKPTDLKVISVYDVLGRMVGSFEGNKIEDNGSYILNVESIPAGTYYVKSYDDEGNAYQRQILIKK